MKSKFLQQVRDIMRAKHYSIRTEKIYQTPYGPTPVNRHCYQSSSGGKTFCPLEQAARIVLTSTPKFAKMISSKYADLGASRVLADRVQNHGRRVTRS